MAFTKESAMDVIRTYESYYAGVYTNYSGGSPDIEALVENFFETVKKVIDSINPNSKQVISNVTDIAQAACYLSLNTFPKEKIEGEDYKMMKAMFDELNKLLDDCLVYARPLMVNVVGDGKLEYVEKSDDTEATVWSDKIDCFVALFEKNMQDARHAYSAKAKSNRTGMILQSLENLYKVVHRINAEWPELAKRGFSKKVFCAYRENIIWKRKIGEEPDENAKYEEFMSIMDGKLKLAPGYERRRVTYVVVEPEFSDLRYIMDMGKSEESICLDPLKAENSESDEDAEVAVLKNAGTED